MDVKGISAIYKLIAMQIEVGKIQQGLYRSL